MDVILDTHSTEYTSQASNMSQKAQVCSSKWIEWHKKANDSRNHHDEAVLHQGISKRNAQWHSTPEQGTPKI